MVGIGVVSDHVGLSGEDENRNLFGAQRYRDGKRGGEENWQGNATHNEAQGTSRSEFSGLGWKCEIDPPSADTDSPYLISGTPVTVDNLGNMPYLVGVYVLKISFSCASRGLGVIMAPPARPEWVSFKSVRMLNMRSVRVPTAILAVGTLCLSPGTVGGQPIPVFVFAGQPNMRGDAIEFKLLTPGDARS